MTAGQVISGQQWQVPAKTLKKNY